MERFSARILRENEQLFQAMLDHRFVSDVSQNRLPKLAFERYLVFEGAFVETAIEIFAFAVARASTIEQKLWLIAVLNSLANEQVTYFEKTFATRGIDPGGFDVDQRQVADFRKGMLAIAAEGGFLDIVTIMFAAEWMYWTWCSKSSENAIYDPLLREWVDLHATPAFKAQACWLRDELDRAAPTLTQEEQAHISALFGHVMTLEIDFHEAAYGD